MTPVPHHNDLAALIQATINPLIAKIQIIENKVDVLSQDRVTRTDLEKLRGEIVGSFVDRASYEARHAALIDRTAALDISLREMRKDVDQDLQKIEDRFKQQQEATLSEKDRAWLRWSQVAGYVGGGLALIGWLMQHVRFN